MASKLKIVLFFILSVTEAANAWGFYAHKLINRQAVYSLPESPLFALFKQNIDYLSEAAVQPDKRRYAVDGEACKHYIDLDATAYTNTDSLRCSYSVAVKRYTEDTLKSHGILPWAIVSTKDRLTEAFAKADIEYILSTSADLGHYVADATVPLHTTKNYDGQLSNQKGIHGLWESRLPELFARDYDLLVGQAAYTSDVHGLAWKLVLGSHKSLEEVFEQEKEATQLTGENKKYAFEERNGQVVRVYSVEYCAHYHRLLNGQVNARMATAIKAVADLWYTAWVDAGQPTLPNRLLANSKTETQHHSDNCQH